MHSVKRLLVELNVTSIKLYWWRHPESQYGNFGDEISTHLLKKILGLKIKWSPVNDCDIIGAGSILEHLPQANKSNKNITIWGAGFIEESTSTLDYDRYDILALRGKSTLSRIKNLPEKNNIALGDPGLLANKLLRTGVDKAYKVGVVPHFYDKDSQLVRYLSEYPDVLIINPLDPCLDVIKQIASCDVILSSSLHGLIVADSFSIPNLHVIMSDKLEGGQYKFIDYYSVFKSNRYNPQQASQIINMNIPQIMDFVKNGYKFPDDLEHIQARLTSAIASRYRKITL